MKKKGALGRKNMKSRAAGALLIPVFILSCLIANAQDDNRDSKAGDADKSKVVVRPGMELRKLGGINLIIPKGAEVYKDRGQWKTESPEDYAVRGVAELRERIDKLEKSNEDLKNEIKQIKEEIKKSGGY